MEFTFNFTPQTCVLFFFKPNLLRVVNDIKKGRLVNIFSSVISSKMKQNDDFEW